jgi:drug/metabolite transporter (DMT)-like permease
MTPAKQLYRQSIRRGALFLLCSSVVFSGVGALVKTLTADIPIEMVVFFRNGAGLLILLPLLLMRNTVSLKTNRLWDHTARAVSGVMAMYCFFYAIKHLHLSEAISLNFTSPLIIPVISYMVIREKLPVRMAGLLLIGFIGMLLIVKPGVGVFKPAALVGILSAFFAAFALVNIRRLTSTEPAIRVVFYFAVIGSVLTIFPMLRVWQNPNPVQWMMLIGIGALATIGQYLLTRGYASGPAGKLAVFHYSAVIFAGVVDWVIWSSRPDAWALCGVGLICLAGVVVSRSEKTPTTDQD